MRKLWLCLFYALCVFTIVFSLFWMALPRLPPGRADSAEETPVPSLPSISVQAVPETGSTTYYLCDEGGRVVVWQCDADGTPVQRVLRTGIYVNPVSYTHLTLPTMLLPCRSRWSPYH